MPNRQCKYLRHCKHIHASLEEGVIEQEELFALKSAQVHEYASKLQSTQRKSPLALLIRITRFVFDHNLVVACKAAHRILLLVVPGYAVLLCKRPTAKTALRVHAREIELCHEPMRQWLAAPSVVL